MNSHLRLSLQAKLWNSNHRPEHVRPDLEATLKDLGVRLSNNADMNGKRTEIDSIILNISVTLTPSSSTGPRLSRAQVRTTKFISNF